MALQGRIYIDGFDAFTRYGLVMKYGGYAAVLQLPQFKKLDTNDWQEDDGIEADLDSPVLDSRTLSLTFYALHPMSSTEADVFIYDLKQSAYHTFSFPEIGRTHQLRYVSCSSYAVNSRFDTLTVTFAEDLVSVTSATVPDAGSEFNVKSYGYMIDNYDVCRLSCYVMQGTRANIERFPNSKESLATGNSITAGKTYDSDATFHAKSRDLTLNLYMYTNQLNRFTRRWNALCTLLTASGYRTVSCDGYSFKCFYKNMSVKKVHVAENGGVQCEFSVTFTVCKYLSGGEWYYLIAENGSAILTEDGNYIIRINN